MNLKQIHTKALKVYHEVSSIALKYFRQSHDNYEQKEESGRLSVVTKADLKINEVLINKLPEILPGSGVIGEEDSLYNKEEYVWIIDPIDGSGNYQKGLDFWGISISLWKATDPIYGVLLFPRLVDSMYFGFKGEGVYDQNNKQIKRRSKSTFKPAFQVESAVPGFAAHILKQDFGQNLSYRATGSIVFDGYNLIRGGYDFSIIYKLAPWDIGAIILLTKELGYTVDFLNRKLTLGDSKFSEYEHQVYIAKPDVDPDIFKIVSNAINEFEKK